jgi:hypothetical protein
MANTPLTKRGLIDKANTTVVITVSVAVFLAVFSLVATKTLGSQARDQGRVIAAKREARDQLKADINSVTDLKQSYSAFLSTTQNAIGGNPNGTGQQDGNNAKIVLDALPSTYDFPALATGLETLVGTQSVKINSISGTDDEIAQAGTTTSTAPEPIAIPFNISVTGDYGSVQNVITAFERSIRPVQLLTLDISGTQGALTLSVSAQTYYQPAKSLNINAKVIQ